MTSAFLSSLSAMNGREPEAGAVAGVDAAADPDAAGAGAPASLTADAGALLAAGLLLAVLSGVGLLVGAGCEPPQASAETSDRAKKGRAHRFFITPCLKPTGATMASLLWSGSSEGSCPLAELRSSQYSTLCAR